MGTSRRTRYILWAVLGAAVTAVVLLILGAIVSSATTSAAIRATQQVNTNKADKRDETLLLMQDCVTPGGKCFERSQQRTAKVVGNIGLNSATAAAAAASCAARAPSPTFEQLYACTLQRMNAAAKQPIHQNPGPKGKPKGR